MYEPKLGGFVHLSSTVNLTQYTVTAVAPHFSGFADGFLSGVYLP